MLVAAYTRLVTQGELLDREGWAREEGISGGSDRALVASAVTDLSGRNLAHPAGGGRLAVTTVGVERIERQGLADADLIARQFALRRKILGLLEARRVAGEEGLPVDQIAAVIGESVERVTPSLLVLRDRFLLQVEIPSAVRREAEGAEGEAGVAPRYRISETGRRALPASRQAWPLSADLEGTGGKSHGGQSAQQPASAPAGEVEGAGAPEGDVEGEPPVGAPEGRV
jgi:hypothetical protein